MTDRTAHPAAEARTVSRRALLAGAVVGGAGAAVLGSGLTASADAKAVTNPKATITVLGTTDLHGHIYNWDYYKDAEYDDTAHNDVGIAKIATLVKAMRDERDHTLTLDAGDTIQGTPLTYYYAAVDPITGPKAPTHPMAAAMNEIGYDAACLGNHEFNYGIPVLRKFQSQLHHPLLGANALDWKTRAPAFPEFTIKKIKVAQVTDSKKRPTDYVNVAIVGFVTPGVTIWDKANVDGKIAFNGIVEQAKIAIPRARQAGADIVIVSCHSGATTSSSYGNALPFPENASTLLAQQVPGIDAILVGHAHVEVPQRYVTNTKTGKDVLLCEPYYWGMRLAVMDLAVEYTAKKGWQVTSAKSTLLNSNTAPADADVLAVSKDAHDKTRAYVNSVIGTSTAALSAATSRYEDTAAIDFINYVQAEAVKAATKTTLPVLSIAAPFNKLAAIPQGNVTVRDIAGLYIYDNTLEAIQLSGAQVKAYLEFSALYFKQVTGTGPFTPDQLTNAVTATAPNGTPDYNYDIMGGFDAPLTYQIDIAKPGGSRILNLQYGGKAVADTDQFVVAINNYRASGGGNFPGVTSAPVLYNAQVAITQLLIQWVTDHKTVDPALFSKTDWTLVSGGQPITITPAPAFTAAERAAFVRPSCCGGGAR